MQVALGVEQRAFPSFVAGAETADITLRPIRAADLPLLREFVRHLSPDTGYKRLLSGRTPTEEELRRWTAIDVSREGAVVAIANVANGERLVGVARYVMQSPEAADFAIVLADAWQGRGLGRELMASLISAAREHGVRKLSGTTLSTNVAMRSLARAMGFRASRLSDALAIMVSLNLSP
ncbi:MAG: N-acetyltransferase [Variovorax sp.]|nr:MAG: N-acetyltransferase [Variovorax sp.]